MRTTTGVYAVQTSLYMSAAHSEDLHEWMRDNLPVREWYAFFVMLYRRNIVFTDIAIATDFKLRFG
jgi:5'(3')-deoxyribonucleotidase